MDESVWISQFAGEDALHLIQVGHAHYSLADVARAAEMFGRAVQVAEAADEAGLALSARRWWGATLFEAGNLRRALTALAPIFAVSEAEDREELYVALIKYTETAQLLPVKHRSICAAHQRLDDLTPGTFSATWRHMAMRLRADLAHFRGQHGIALQHAEFAWHLARNPAAADGPRFLSDEYLSCLVRAQLAVSDPVAAGETLRVWRETEDEIPSYRDITFNSRCSEYERYRGNLDVAVDLARAGLVAAEAANHFHGRILAVNALTRSLVLLGQVDQASDVLDRLADRLGDESKLYRYEFESLRVRLIVGAVPTRRREGRAPPVGRRPEPLGHLDSLEQTARDIDALLESDVWTRRAELDRHDVAGRAETSQESDTMNEPEGDHGPH